ncbi:hypothetical protein SASC598O02_015950 [Snodgrassella alvi SCGC AB-598-O02]|nr:hypothetical protein SASC598O02_015950 [Snodgrassella alvi SCGC AB-598-O02]
MATLQTMYLNFKDNIALTRECDRYKKAREKDDVIKDKVSKAFCEEGYEVHSTFLQGSLATHTGIIPIDGDYDIDRAIAITKASSPDNPLEPKKIIKYVLENHNFKEPKIKKPCVTADYINEPFHIDFPTYRVDSIGHYELAVGKEFSDQNNRSWSPSDPKGLVEWITSEKNHQAPYITLTEEEKYQFYRLVRYMKRWRDERYSSKSERKKVYSVALTIMIKESFCPNIDDSGKADDHKALKDTLEIMINRYFTRNSDGNYSIRVTLPVLPYNNIYQDKGEAVGKLLHPRLKNLLNALKEVDTKDTLKAQCELLRKHFGNDFPESNNEIRDKGTKAGLVGVSDGA